MTIWGYVGATNTQTVTENQFQCKLKKRVIDYTQYSNTYIGTNGTAWVRVSYI